MFNYSIWKNSFVLGVIALISGFLIIITYEETRGYISDSKSNYDKRYLLQVMPVKNYGKDVLNDVLKIPKKYFSMLGIESGDLNLIKVNGQLISVIIPSVAHDGYNGKIRILVGINLDGSIVSVRVVSHNETPGLGDKLDLGKSDWILNFNDKSLKNLKSQFWKVKKDGGHFDQFTGATITPRAVIHQVHSVLKYYKIDKSRIVKEANTSIKHKKNMMYESTN